MASGGLSFQELLGWLSQSSKDEVIFEAMPEVAGTKPSELFQKLAREATSDRPLIYAYQGGDIKECGAFTLVDEHIKRRRLDSRVGLQKLTS